MMPEISRRCGPFAAAAIGLLLGLGSGLEAHGRQAARPAPPKSTYWVYAGAESADLIHRIRFGPQGMAVEVTTTIGELPNEMEGPHGLVVSRDGKYLYMTTGHGRPEGKLWKYELGATADKLVGEGISLGNFPASVDVTPDGLYALSVNFNLHGDMVPSTVSVVYTPTREEVARVVTCTMPHGSRIDTTGTRQYSTCMMDDQLVEIDAVKFGVARRFSLAKGKEGPIAVGAPDAHAGHAMAGAASPAKPPVDPAEVGYVGEKHQMTPATCSPTWAQPSADDKKIFVACNKADEIVEVDRATWAITRRLPTGRGVYNLAVTPDGRKLDRHAETGKPGRSLRSGQRQEPRADQDVHDAGARSGREPRLPLRICDERGCGVGAGQGGCDRSQRARRGRHG